MTGTASVALHAGAAVVGLLLTAMVLVLGRQRALLVALAGAAASVWAGAVALDPANALSGPAGALEILRMAVFFAVLIGLTLRFGGPRARPLALRFALGGGIVALVAFVAVLPQAQGVLAQPSFGSVAILARIGLALLVILLAENLFRNASEPVRWHVSLPCIALGGLAAFDVLLYAEAALSRGFSASMLDARAALTGLALPLLLLAAGRDRRLRRDPPVSREVVFHGATLLLAGVFLLSIGTAAELLRHIDPAWSGMAQASLLAAALMAIAVAATTRSARSRVRRLVVDHFFSARYDYRREWLRSVATLATPADEAPAPVRAIRAVGDPVDSPGGVLLLREEETGRLVWGASWNAPQAALSFPAGHAILEALRHGAWIAEFRPGEGPADIEEAYGPVWLAVPLRLHAEGLFGIVLLRPPRAPFTTDREVFELLRTLGRQAAMFLAERKAAERLVDQSHLHDYAKRFAFVAHDVKTVSSQLTLLLANAEDNIADPEFQRDMLLTVRASAARINALIARLRQPDETSLAAADQPAGIDPGERLRALLAARPRAIRIEEDGQADRRRVAIAGDRFDTALEHLINNAEDASGPDRPVLVRLRQQAGRVVIDITDQGPGMTPEFIRDELFRPFGTAKPQGSGIGAWQARDMLRAAGGDLVVLSEVGAGTTMRVTLPLRGAAAEAPGMREDRA